VAWIAAAFPQARFVHIVRDGRDVAVSVQNTWFGRGKTISDIAAEWANRIADFRIQTSELGLPVHTVHYEELAESPSLVLKTVCEFIELPYTAAMLRYHETARQRLKELSDLRWGARTFASSERIATHSMALKPPTMRRIGRWREALRADQVETFESLASSMLRELGYQVSR
jgi:hypothetical protein